MSIKPDEGLAEPDAVAQERSAVLAGDVHQRPVRLLLVLVEHGEHLRVGPLPLGSVRLVLAEHLVQCSGVHVERRVLVRVPLDGPQQLRRHVFGVVPVLLVPPLELGDLAARSRS